MKKYWKNAKKKTGKVREIRQSKKVGTMFGHQYKYQNKLAKRAKMTGNLIYCGILTKLMISSLKLR